MTFKRHPMDKRLRAPRPRRRPVRTGVVEAVSRAFRDMSKAVETVAVDLARPLRAFAADFAGHPRGFRQIDYVKAI